MQLFFPAFVSSHIFLSTEMSLQDWGHMDSFSCIGMEINKVSQNTVSQQQNDYQALNVNGVDLRLFDEVANQEANSDTWNIAASSIEEFDRLSTDEFVWFSVDFLTVFACITVRNASHVDIRVDICPDHAAQETQEVFKD